MIRRERQVGRRFTGNQGALIAAAVQAGAAIGASRFARYARDSLSGSTRISRATGGSRRRGPPIEPPSRRVRIVSKPQAVNRKGRLSVKKRRRRTKKNVSKADKWAAQGSVGMYEISNEGVSADNSSTLAFGHGSTPLQSLGIQMFLCLIRKLVRKMGVEFTSIDEVAYCFNSNSTPTHAIWLGVQFDPFGTVVEVQYSLALDLSYYVHATNLHNAYFDFTPGSSNNYSPSVKYIRYGSISGNTDQHRVNLVNADLEFECYSTMRLQNRTNGETAADSEALDVTNNPLIVKEFDVRGNQLQMKSVDNVTSAGATIDNQSGLLPNAFITTAGAFFQPSREVQFCTGTKKFVMQPGGFYTSKLTYKRKMKVDHLLKELSFYHEDGASFLINNGIRVPLGITRAFHFDKYLDTKQAAAGVAKVKVGYQLNLLLKVHVTVKNSRVMPYQRTF